MDWVNHAWDRMRGSLRWRVAIPFIVLSLVIFVGLYFLLSNTAEETRVTTLRSDLEGNAQIAAYVVSYLLEDPDRTLDLDQELLQFADATDTRMTLIAADGAVLVDTEFGEQNVVNQNDKSEVVAAREDGTGWDRRRSTSSGEPSLYVAVQVPNSDGLILRVSVPTTEVQHSVVSILRAIILACLFSIVAFAVAGWYFAGRLARPLEDLTRQAMRIAVGDFSARVPEVPIREINGVGRAFNRMADRLEDVMERQEQTSLRLESVLEGLLDGVVLTDEQGLVLRMNPAAEQMLNSAEEEVVGKPFVQAARDYEIARVLNKAFDGKENATGTVEHGIERRAIQVHAGVVQGVHEKLGLVVLHDVTEIRRLETVRREFVANVSHELRTPLTSIRAMVETLEAGAVEEPEVALDFLARIVGEIDRLNALLEDLLDFARLEAGRTPLRLEYQLIDEVLRHGAGRLQEQIERAGLTLEIDLEDELPEMAVDVGRIEQVLINLLHNAIKFTPGGGKVTLRAWREKNTVYVALKDTGVGIPDAEQARLFERFYKSDKARRSDGTGLGLAIAQNIVRLHGGRIWVESTPGEGAEFTFTLPMKRKKAAKRARKHTLKGLV
ncbi:MAG: HAMP domain-containing protein [Thermomicrobiales bacterium]|nr:HAMP domain-containing protein [Thermomicrobiales bacterium]